MEKKEGWFSALKKALCFKVKEKQEKKTHKPRKGFFGKLSKWAPVSSSKETVLAICSPLPAPAIPDPLPSIEKDVKLTEIKNEQNKHAFLVAITSTVAVEAVATTAQAAVVAQAAAKVVRLSSCACSFGKSEEEIAAIVIQTAFRGYLARRALRALRGLLRLKSFIQGQSVKCQTASTLKYMQTLARMESQIRARRNRILEENQALQRQQQQKRDKELQKLRNSMSGDWDDSTKSKEQVEAKLQSKQEATMRRERALAYAFSHQRMWKISSKSANSTFLDPNNPHWSWSWSWLERWMAARPWKNRSVMDQCDCVSVKSTASRAISVGEITKAYSCHDLNQYDKSSPTEKKPSRPPSRQSPLTPPSKAPSLSLVTERRKTQSPKGSGWSGDDDLRSMLSAQSDRCRRHSIIGSSVKDDESLASSPAIPSYMAPTQSAKVRSRLPSPLGPANNGTLEKGSADSIKKRLSFSASSPAGLRRHSNPTKVDSTSIKDIGADTGNNVDKAGNQ